MDTDFYNKLKQQYENQDVSRPKGKFSGEHISTEYFYSLMGEGDFICGQDDGNCNYVEIFEVDDEERAAFNFDSNISNFGLRENDQGFVYGTPLTKQERKEYEEHWTPDEDEIE